MRIDAILNKTERVTVEMSIYDLYRNLLEGLGIESSGSRYSDILEEDGKYYIIKYADISRHGSADYREIKREEISEYKYLSIKGLLDIKQLIKRTSFENDLEELIYDKKDIEYKIKLAKENLSNI